MNESEGMRFLQDKVAGADKEREERAVTQLLALGHHVKNPSEYDSPLVRAMLKQTESNR